MTASTIGPARFDEAETLTGMIRNSSAYHGEHRVMVANQTVDRPYIEANLVRVARGADGVALGFYSVLVPGCGAPGEGEVDFMFVDDDAQGRGIGRALIEDLRVQAAALELTRVHVVSHPPSEAFYLACGAHRIGMSPPVGRVTWARPHLVVDIAER
ncbi:MAG TPA: GNAT family N-acetyltransferase [Jiangellaceae bacterium]